MVKKCLYCKQGVLFRHEQLMLMYDIGVVHYPCDLEYQRRFFEEKCVRCGKDLTDKTRDRQNEERHIKCHGKPHEGYPGPAD